MIILAHFCWTYMQEICYRTWLKVELLSFWEWHFWLYKVTKLLSIVFVQFKLWYVNFLLSHILIKICYCETFKILSSVKDVKYYLSFFVLICSFLIANKPFVTWIPNVFQFIIYLYSLLTVSFRPFFFIHFGSFIYTFFLFSLFTLVSFFSSFLKWILNSFFPSLYFFFL